jgi:hypothetical protein
MRKLALVCPGKNYASQKHVLVQVEKNMSAQNICLLLLSGSYNRVYIIETRCTYELWEIKVKKWKNGTSQILIGHDIFNQIILLHCVIFQLTTVSRPIWTRSVINAADRAKKYYWIQRNVNEFTDSWLNYGFMEPSPTKELKHPLGANGSAITHPSTPQFEE